MKRFSTFLLALFSTVSFAQSIKVVAGAASIGICAGCGSIKNATPNLPSMLVVTLQPQSQNVYQGSSVTVTAAVSAGISPYVYHQIVNGTEIGTGASYTFSSAGNIYYHVTDAANNYINTNTATITIIPTLAIASQPSPLTLNAGQSGSFTATSTGGVGSTRNWTWYKNGLSVGGVTTNTYNYSGASIADSGVNIYAIVNDGNGHTATTSTVKLIVHDTTGQSGSPVPLRFSYTILNNSMTSAGLYRIAGSDTVKVRSLWDGIYKTSGSYDTFVNGRDDGGKLLTDGPLLAIVLQHNVYADWSGTAMNSSLDSSGYGKITGTSPTSMTFINNRFYIFPSYQENNYQIFGGNISTLNRAYPAGNFIDQTTIDAQSDGIRNYIVAVNTQIGTDANTRPNYLYATDSVMNEIDYGSYGTVVVGNSSHNKHNSVLLQAPDSNNQRGWAGLGVQKTGNCIFVVRSNNRLYIVNKTGAIIDTSIVLTSLTSFNSIAPKGVTCSPNGNLWAALATSSGYKIQEFIFSSNGVYGGLGTTITGVSYPYTLTVNPSGDSLKTIDADKAVQVIKTFNTHTGVLSSTYGQLGGNYGNTLVATNRFNFNNDITFGGPAYSFIRYCNDGSYVVNDWGTARTQRFSANNILLDTLIYQGFTYEVVSDFNNPNYIYSNFMKVRVDYSKTNAQRGWQLVNNYRARIDPNILEQPGAGLHEVNTYPNGHTYATCYTGGAMTWYDITNDTGWRNTGVTMNDHSHIGRDGNIYSWNSDGSTFYDTYKYLVSFDGSYNPVFTSPVGGSTYSRLNLNPSNVDSFPWVGGNAATMLKNGVQGFFNVGYNRGYHFGIMPPTRNTYTALTARSTLGVFNKIMPFNGFYDIGNGSNFYGGDEDGIDSFFVWSFRGENWNQGQFRTHNLVDRYGLNIATFGAYYDKNIYAAPRQAGNVFKPVFVKDNQSKYHIWENDESAQGGNNRFDLQNLNTIKYSYIPMVKNGTPSIPFTAYKNLMDSLPITSNIPNAYGWTHSPYIANYFGATTNFTIYDPLLPPDIQMFAHAQNRDQHRVDTVSRVMNGNGNDWDLQGQAMLLQRYANAGNPANHFAFYITDSLNNVIIEFEYRLQSDNSISLIANVSTPAQTFVDNDGADVTLYAKPVDFDIHTQGSNVVFTFRGQTITIPARDSAAILKRPKRVLLSIYNDSENPNDVFSIDFINMNFNPNY